MNIINVIVQPENEDILKYLEIHSKGYDIENNLLLPHYCY
jgi:hypothetical protein